MLYAPELHEPLTETTWSEARARDAVQALVADAERAYSPDLLWPAHEWDGYGAALPLKKFYVGAAGVVWTLQRLRLRGCGSTLDLQAAAKRALELFRTAPDYVESEILPEQKRSGLLCGETGIALVAWQLGPTDTLEAELLDLVHGNLENPANELMWGAPGTLLAARAIHARTGSAAWADAVVESEGALRAQRDADGLWTQHLWGETWRGLSPIHGLVGNVVALGEIGNAADILRERANIEDGYANWGDLGRLQWCVGAPGIVAHAASYLDEDLLLAAAQLVFDAGPAGDEKGAGICHGTSGNGFALLKTFERTGDELWLERARAFAMHALEQAQRLPGRYSLFTGSIGAALFASDCVDGRAQFPVVDSLEP
ncbi:MAG TPA: LanC-like protein [Gaiellaceae bacterium]